jgi:heme-degrading monooxygenase HmoA
MPTVLILHDVDDYGAWKSAFDDAAGLRKQAGEVSFDLLRFDEDANRVVHLSEWNSLEAARRFFQSAEVAEIRRQAGVHEPQFHYLERLESGVL